MAELSRIAVVNMAVEWWTAGESFTRMLVESLAAAARARDGSRKPVPHPRGARVLPFNGIQEARDSWRPASHARLGLP